VGARKQGMREMDGGRMTVMASVRCHGLGDTSGQHVATAGARSRPRWRGREKRHARDDGGRRTVMASVRCHGLGDAGTRRATASPHRAHCRGLDGVGAKASGAGQTTTTTAEVTTTTRAGHARGSAGTSTENTTTTTAEVTTTTRTRARGTGCKNEREDQAATGKNNCR
jgi:hypothetical protein